MSRLTEAAEKHRAHVEKMTRAIEESGGADVLDFSKVTVLEGADAKERLATFQKMNAELVGINTELAEARKNDDDVKAVLAEYKALNDPSGGRLGPGASFEKSGTMVGANGLTDADFKSLGEKIAETDEFKSYDANSKSGRFSVEISHPSFGQKTLIQTTTGWAVQPVPVGPMLATATRRPVVADLIPQQSISLPQAAWMEETTFTNAAAAVAEGAAKPESTLAYTRRESTAKKIATSFAVTSEQLEDVPQFQALLNTRGTIMVQLVEEVEILTGDGTGAHLLGFNSLPNILTRARGGDENVEAIFKMFTQIRSSDAATVYAEPSGVVIHPTNWQGIRLMRTNGGTGEFLFGPPSESGLDTVWGKKTIVTPAQTLGTALTGDFELFSTLYRYKGIRVEVGYVNNQFVENEKTVVIEERIILAILKQQAFGLITGLN